MIDISDVVHHLYSLPNVKKEEVGSIRFCLGEHVPDLVATLNDIKVTASFYGVGITTWISGEVESILSCNPDIGRTIHTFFVLDNASISPEQVD